MLQDSALGRSLPTGTEAHGGHADALRSDGLGDPKSVLDSGDVPRQLRPGGAAGVDRDHCRLLGARVGDDEGARPSVAPPVRRQVIESRPREADVPGLQCHMPRLRDTQRRLCRKNPGVALGAGDVALRDEEVGHRPILGKAVARLSPELNVPALSACRRQGSVSNRRVASRCASAL